MDKEMKDILSAMRKCKKGAWAMCGLVIGAWLVFLVLPTLIEGDFILTDFWWLLVVVTIIAAIIGIAMYNHCVNEVFRSRGK